MILSKAAKRVPDDWQNNTIIAQYYWRLLLKNLTLQEPAIKLQTGNISERQRDAVNLEFLES